MNEDDDRVSLGGWEFAATRLRDEPEVEADRDDAARGLRELIENPGGIEPLPREGWIRLVDSDSLVVFGCRSDEWGEGSWVTVALKRHTSSGWQFHGSAYGVWPEPTRAALGAGLRLAWPTDEFEVQAGQRPELSVLLINDRPIRWSGGEGRDLVAVASLRDLSTGERFRPSSVGVTGGQPDGELDPGQSMELHAVLAVEKPSRLPPTTYGVEVTVWTLDLSLSGGRLRVGGDEGSE
jgi:hypothetical protein